MTATRGIETAIAVVAVVTGGAVGAAAGSALSCICPSPGEVVALLRWD